MNTRLTLYVVDDDSDIRTSMVRLADAVNLPCQAYENAERFLAAYDPLVAGCLILDLHMPGMGGLTLQRRLAADGDPMPVIVITGYPDVPSAVEAMKAGAADFFQKPFRPLALLDSIQNAIQKSERHRVELARKRAATKRFAALTPREREVIQQVAIGRSNTQIAERLGVTPQAVDARRSSAYDKLGVQNVPELVRFLIRVGLDSIEV